MAKSIDSVIELNQLEFYVRHGVYPLEKEVRQTFKVDLKLTIELPAKQRVALNETVDYTKVHSVVAEIMEIPEELLENLILKILDAIFDRFKPVLSCSCRIEKFPQFGGRGAVALCLSQKRNFNGNEI